MLKWLIYKFLFYKVHVMKTFIRRPGNKTKQLKHIIPLIPEFTGTYIEPFLGTGAIYLNLLPKKAILNNFNTDIINIWKLVKDDPEYIIKEINKFKKIFLPKNNDEKLKYCKKILAKMDTYIGNKRTILYLILIYCSFNGTLINKSNEWYISGLYIHIYQDQSVHIFTENFKNKIRKLSEILSNKSQKIYNTDYIKILEKAQKGDFVFLDPPYIEDRNYAFNYNKEEIFDINELKSQVDILTKNKVKWMMTQIDTPDVRLLFKKYKNNSNFQSTVSTSKKEVIITNYF